MSPLDVLVVAAWSLPLVAIVSAGTGLLRARRRARTAANRGLLPELLIAQITTTGVGGAAEEVLARLRALPCPVPLELWVVVDEGSPRTRYAGADRVLVVPAEFRCRAQAKGRALEWARLQRLAEGVDGPDTKILLLDDDSVPTAAYLRMAVEADADIAQGVVAPRNHYGRPLSHLDDLRPLHCLAVCSWAQGTGHPVHVHGEGLCLRASAEHAVGWNARGAALAEDLVFGQRAAALGLTWAFLPAVVEITSPWSAQAFVTQRRRWSWGTLQALPHLPAPARRRVGGLYVITLGAFALSIFGTISTLAGGRSLAGPWPVALGAWLGLFALAGWISSRGRVRQALLAVILAWPSALINALVVPFSLAIGPPRRFRTIAKLPPRGLRPGSATNLARAPAFAVASAALLLPAGMTFASAINGADAPGWNTLNERPIQRTAEGVLRAEGRRVGLPPRALQTAPDLTRGLTVITYGNDEFFRLKANRLLNRIAALGATTVSLSVPIFTEGLEANGVRTDDQLTPSRHRILMFGQAAQRRNLTVTLSPLLDEKVLLAAGGWRGKLRPDDRSAWFNSYAEVLARFAAIAEHGGFQGLNVGTELESLSLDPRWRRVLSAVRERFGGTVSYAMAGSRVLDPRPGWLLRNVDLIGINPWYPLDLPDGASSAEMSGALAPWAAEIMEFRGRVATPVVFAEAGGRSVAGAYRHPARVIPGAAIEMEAQSHIYRAICRLRRRVDAEGVIWWATTLDPPSPAEADGGFDPLGKPAEREIERCGPDPG